MDTLFKNKNVITVIFLVLMYFYGFPNIISIISGILISFTGELYRLNFIGHNMNSGKRIFLGNTILMSGLIVISNVLFPYVLILFISVNYFMYRKSDGFVNEPKIENGKNLRERMRADFSVVRSWTIAAAGFIIIWGIRRL